MEAQQTSPSSVRIMRGIWHLALVVFGVLGFVFLADLVLSIRLQSPLAVRHFFYNPWVDAAAFLSPFVVGISYRRVRGLIAPGVRGAYLAMCVCCVLYVTWALASAIAFALED